VGVPAARSDCPGSTLFYGALDPAIPISEVASRVDTLFSIQGCDRVHARYDLPAGLLIAAVDVACPADFGRTPSGIETVIEDDFEVVGLAPGTPAVFDVALHLDGEGHDFGEPGYGSGGARLRATILEGASHSVSLERATSTPEPSIYVSERLALALSEVAGTPFRLRLAVRAEAFDGRAALDGRMEFEGLAAGVVVRSGRGYSSASPVPLRATGWGRLKARYR